MLEVKPRGGCRTAVRLAVCTLCAWILPAMAGASRLDLISAGGGHTCAVTTVAGVMAVGPAGQSVPLAALSTARLAWNHDGSMTDGYALSINGTRNVVTPTCADAGGVRSCEIPFPALTPGEYTLSVSAFNASGEGVAEPFRVTVVVYPTQSVQCWGDNSSGQLGDGTTTSRFAPVAAAGLLGEVAAIAAGGSHTCVVTSGGGVKCWGANSYGQLGDGTQVARNTPVDVAGLAGVTAIAAGEFHTCAIAAGGALKCWGRNHRGQVGDGTLTNRLVPTDVAGLSSGVARVAAGGEGHTCAVTGAGAVKCWGGNAAGQLGDGTTTTRRTPVDVPALQGGVATVVAGYRHTCALTAGGGVKCWGNNAYGQVGDGSTVNRAAPADVSGLAGGVLGVTAGKFQTCAVTAGGRMKCWGNNASGELGDGTQVSRSVPTDVPSLTGGIASAMAGYSHTCAVTSGGGLRCWGDNALGQLGDAALVARLSPARVLGFGRFDFDGDDLADVAVYRPSTGSWFSLDSSSGNTAYRVRGWGLQAEGDVPAFGDFDGDGIADPTVFRGPAGTWFILESHANFTTWKWFGWGSATDVLVPGDYDGDGRTDAAVFRPSNGTWYVRPSNGAPSWSVTFGQAGDQPLDGDFDGDGRRDPAVYRPSTGTWNWLESSTNFTGWRYRGWGMQAEGDRPAPGDYDGDGKTDLCVFRPATGTWLVLESQSAWTTWTWVGWGTSSDLLTPADYDGDGKADAALHRPSTGEWFVKPSGGASPWNVVFGSAGDVIVR